MELSEIRKNIDSTDSELLELFLRRMDLVKEVAATKSQTGRTIEDKTREREILRRVSETSGDRAPYARGLFGYMMGLSKAYQASLNSAGDYLAEFKKAGVFPGAGIVACQGVEGANAQEACDRMLPMGDILYVSSFPAVIEAVQSGLCRFGVLPVENNSAGSVRSVYDMLIKSGLSIVRSTKLGIRHQLLGVRGASLLDIKEIHSHEQAIAQCSGFLNGLKNVKIIPCENTATAARMVSDAGDVSAAAISSPRCAELYGLDTLKSDIQDNSGNMTRFVCVEKAKNVYEGANRITIAFSCENRPGALYDIMTRIAVNGCNMSKLESIPVQNPGFEFLFIADLEASIGDPGVPEMLAGIKSSCQTMDILGCYAEM